jgi:class 3 adenylate cyclase
MNMATMDQARQVTVLFADVSDSTKLYESEGDTAAMQAIACCVDRLRQSVESSGGRVVKTIGDEVMAVFPTPDAAAVAAGRMQHAIDALPLVGATRLGVRIGFHYGPVIQSGSDFFGDTVNLAARLVEQAGRSQIITSHETSDRLGPVFRSFKRPLYAIHVKGKVEEVKLCELIWRQADDMTMSFAGHGMAKREPLVLRLKYRDREIVCRRHNDSITLGRDPACGLVIANSRTSRRHCTIERRQDKFVLADQSTNGTYITAEGSNEIFLQREEFMLGTHGWIAFGQPRAKAEDIVEYFCK